MEFRWLATACLLAVAVHVEPVVAQQKFDQSLEALERSRVITAAERKQLEGKALGLRIDRQRMIQACRSGALSARECSTGVAIRSRSRSVFGRAALRGGRLDTPLTVPVSALMAGQGGSFNLSSVFAVTPRPQALPGNADRQLLFPIIGSAVTSSDFGWRLHPVFGSWLMHAGRDLAAQEGSPVVAALSGTVISSGLAGGYGIAVQVEHRNPNRRTLYGHLSEIYVKAGQQVRQGEVIGRVGSTGISTGPHLHFELRRPQHGGWVAVDPGELDLNPLTASSGSGDAVSLLIGQLMETLVRPRSIDSVPNQG
ncbi:MAG: M23 family metallopeptidase [Prochlorococcus sp.]|nr:M23 family metallopeptidase [Prochlorococcus sp.]